MDFLIVDPDANVRALYAALAEHVRLPVKRSVEAPNVDDALRALRASTPAAAIVGPDVPLVQAIVARAPDAFVVVATDRAWNDPTVLASISAGAAGYLRTPVHVSDFRHAFGSWQPASPRARRLSAR